MSFLNRKVAVNTGVGYSGKEGKRLLTADAPDVLQFDSLGLLYRQGLKSVSEEKQSGGREKIDGYLTSHPPGLPP